MMEQLLGLPPDASAQGPALDHLTVMIHWLMFALFAGWGLFFTVMLVRFRSGKNPNASYTGTRTRIGTVIEALVAITEVVLLVVIAIPLWSSRVSGLPDEKGAVVVHVIAEQYAWNIHYPGPDGKFGKGNPKLVAPDNPIGLDRDDPDAKDDIVTNNQLWLPVNKPVIVYLTTKDVIHSFSIPYMRVKQDAIPGEQIPLWFTPIKTSLEVREEVATFADIGMKIGADRASGMTCAGSYTNSAGKQIVGSGETVTDTVIVQLRDAGIGEIEVIHDMSTKVAMQDYSDASGGIVIRKGETLSDSALLALLAVGIRQIRVAPEIPIEIACAQLCGLGHFRMRGYVSVVPDQEYQQWIRLQESYINPDAVPQSEPPANPSNDTTHTNNQP